MPFKKELGSLEKRFIPGLKQGKNEINKFYFIIQASKEVLFKNEVMLTEATRGSAATSYTQDNLNIR